MVDARDLKSLGALSLYEFKSRPGHHEIRVLQDGKLLSPFLLGVKPDGMLERLVWRGLSIANVFPFFL